MFCRLAEEPQKAGLSPRPKIIGDPLHLELGSFMPPGWKGGKPHKAMICFSLSLVEGKCSSCMCMGGVPARII